MSEAFILYLFLSVLKFEILAAFLFGKKHKMKWIKAVWWKNDKQMHRTFPSIWFEDGRDGQKHVRWSPKNQEADALAKRKHPKKNWLKFYIIRIKIRDGM